MRSWRLMAIFAVAAAVTNAVSPSLFAEQTVEAFTPVPFGQPRPRSIDDGWRRTASGWENMADWQVVAYAPATFAVEGDKPFSAIPNAEHLSLLPGWRLDFHPAALALLLVAILAWLAGVSPATPDSNSSSSLRRSAS